MTNNAFKKMYSNYIEIRNRIQNNLDKFPNIKTGAVVDTWEFKDETTIMVNVINYDGSKYMFLVDSECVITDNAFAKFLGI